MLLVPDGGLSFETFMGTWRPRAPVLYSLLLLSLFSGLRASSRALPCRIARNSYQTGGKSKFLNVERGGRLFSLENKKFVAPPSISFFFSDLDLHHASFLLRDN